MCELSRWADDEVIELISITRETTIESFDDLYSVDLLFFGNFFTLFEGISTVDDEVFSFSIHLIVDDDIERSDCWIDFLHSFLDLIVEFFHEIVPVK